MYADERGSRFGSKKKLVFGGGLRSSHIKSGSIGIIHLFYLPLCSLRSLWLNHSDATGNNIRRRYTSFEEWDLPNDSFDAVVAATSFHWIPPEIGCPKVADAWRDNCSLILLWNAFPSPRHEVFQLLEQVYQKYVPSLGNYASTEQEKLNLQAIDKTVIDSGRFQKFSSDKVVYNITYNTDDYLMLLGTLSPYIAFL